MIRSTAPTHHPDFSPPAVSPTAADGLIRITLLALLSLALCACAGLAPESRVASVNMPVLAGWFDGRVAWYITTDVSDAGVAKDKGANHAPRLADTLASRKGVSQATPGAPQAVDKVYAVTNFQQGSIFASAPRPVGSRSTDLSYSPLWEMITVTWQPGQTPRILRSEEEVLQAEERQQLKLGRTGVVLNCPIVQMGDSERLPGVLIRPAP